MHLLPSVAIQPNLELKTWPKQLLGSLPLVITLHDVINVTYPSQPFLHLKVSLGASKSDAPYR